MTNPNVELIRTVYERWRQGDFSPDDQVYGEDLLWGYSDEFPEIAGMERGGTGRSDRLLRWLSTWEHWRTEPEEFLANGDHVVALVRYIGRGKGSGVEVDDPGAHVWELRDGRPVRLVIYSDRARALEEAGIPAG